MLLIKNIGLLQGILPEGKSRLSGKEMCKVESLSGAWLLAENEKIAAFGPMSECPDTDAEIIDARDGIVRPTFCDSHTHLVYAGSREGEFVDKINGLSYEEIARRGGGILNSADRLALTSEDELFESALRRLKQVASLGTGAIEIKSGYGLSTESELKMIRVIRRLAEAMPRMVIRSTFLGAHAVGRAFTDRQREYVTYIINEMLPEVAREGGTDFIDVFCDEGFFTCEETEAILKEGARYGMRPKIHANELACSGGVQVGVKHGALSVDHLERMGTEEIDLLATSSTVATMLPGASFFLGMPYAPAREAIQAGCTVALASDWNPGSSPSGSMPMVESLGCIRMRMRPEESFNAVTINGAAAMGLSEKTGSVTPGKNASLIIYKPWVPSPEYIPYAYTEPTIDHVILKGKQWT